MILPVLIALATASAGADSGCAADRSALLAMDADRFDQSALGWRSVGEKSGCELEGATLIAAYLGAHPDLAVAMRGQLAWHRGQLLALAGRRDDALAVFGTIVDPDPAQHWYRMATMAFLQRDRPSLTAARARLVALPRPADFDALAARYLRETGERLAWPFNLEIVDGLIRCFDSDYRTAYADNCAKATIRPRRAAARSRPGSR